MGATPRVTGRPDAGTGAIPAQTVLRVRMIEERKADTENLTAHRLTNGTDVPETEMILADDVATAASIVGGTEAESMTTVLTVTTAGSAHILKLATTSRVWTCRYSKARGTNTYHRAQMLALVN